MMMVEGHAKRGALRSQIAADLQPPRAARRRRHANDRSRPVLEIGSHLENHHCRRPQIRARRQIHPHPRRRDTTPQSPSTDKRPPTNTLPTGARQHIPPRYDNHH